MEDEVLVSEIRGAVEAKSLEDLYDRIDVLDLTYSDKYINIDEFSIDSNIDIFKLASFLDESIINNGFDNSQSRSNPKSILRDSIINGIRMTVEESITESIMENLVNKIITTSVGNEKEIKLIVEKIIDDVKAKIHAEQILS